FGYDHFAWISFVVADPQPPSCRIVDPANPGPLMLPFIDPCKGGYVGGRPADTLPFYWDEEVGYDSRYWYLGPIARNATALKFEDKPYKNKDLPGGNDPSKYIEFITTLRGVYA